MKKRKFRDKKGKRKVLELLFVGDIHYSEVNPSSRKDNYAEAILTKLREIQKIIEDYAVEAIFFTGDFFHKKRPTFHETHTLIKEFLKFHCRVYGILGNHDIFNIEAMDRRAAGLMVASKAIRILDEEPYIDKFHKVAVTGRSFSPGVLGLPKKKPKHGIRIHVSHLDIYLERPNEFVPAVDEEELDRLGCHILFNGHIHNDTGGPKVEIDETSVYNLGSIGRPRIDEVHQPKVLMVSVDRGIILDEQIIELKSAKPAKDIFLDVRGKLRKNAVDYILEFAKELARSDREKSELDVEVLLKKLSKKYGGKKVLREALAFLDQAS